MRDVDFEIRHGSADDIDRLEPLWYALRDHHATLPEMRPKRERGESWAHRSRQYCRGQRDCQ